MKTLNFKVPGQLNKKEGFNKVVVVGTCEKYSDQTQTYDYLGEFERKNGGSYYKFMASIKQNGSKFKINGLNSGTNPNRTKVFADLVEDGMKIKASGTFNENYNQEKDRYYRDALVWSIVKAEDDEEEGVMITLSGKIGMIQKVEDGVEFSVIVPSQNANYEDKVFRIYASNNNPYTKWILDSNVAVSDWVTINAYYVNIFEKDGFGNVIMSINRVELYLVKQYAKGDGMGLDLNDLPF